jgi:fumarylpyruvate hydrolase
MGFVLPPVLVPTLPVVDSDDVFSVRRVFCVGRNYAAHAREMGHDPNAEPPFFFTKPADAVVAAGPDGRVAIPYPAATSDLHYEVELVVALGAGGANLTEEQAQAAVWGYAVGIDLTRRDLQATAKKLSRPWDMAKGFDNSAPIGPLHPAYRTGPMHEGEISLSVAGEQKQHGDLADMIWPVAPMLAYLSGLVELRAGDLIFTGTPEGVGPLQRGQTAVASIAGLGSLSLTVGE